MPELLVKTEPGGSNAVKVPSGARTAACNMPLASMKASAIAPSGLMPSVKVTKVPWPAPVPAPGASKVVMAPSGERRKP
jgi:hypothetical protein